MGHYCRICGRIRANEKFSGKGHKNHTCKDCSGKSDKKVKRNSLTKNKNAFAPEPKVASNDELSQPEDMYFNDNWFSEIEFEKRELDDEELPFERGNRDG